MNGKVTIINANQNAHSIISSAGRISTTKGSANEIYEAAQQNEEQVNIKLINKIIASGHESVLEHVSVNLSFDNVSVFVEQFMIEFRLASFTVKSRRYVDFGEAGYVMPDFYAYGEEAEALKQIYQAHMKYLFEAYDKLVEKGIPKEDARFVLPYSFKSNFYCTVNIRELKKIMWEMVYGRGKDLPELVELGNSLCSQCAEFFPYLKIEEKPIEEITFQKKKDFSREELKEELVTLIQGTNNPEELICRAALLSQGVYDIENFDINQQKSIISQLLQGTRKRELEQANFTCLFNKISLAGVTHLVRHRMQSIVIPDYLKVCSFDKYVLPQSIVECGLEEIYREIFKKSAEVWKVLKDKGFDGREKVYLLLSGMTIPVMTTMNANEIYVFMKLRTCNRAQWEIKACADGLLEILRENYPVLFSQYGPSCFVSGKCPEGRMTCGKIREICEDYKMK